MIGSTVQVKAEDNARSFKVALVKPAKAECQRLTAERFLERTRITYACYLHIFVSIVVPPRR